MTNQDLIIETACRIITPASGDVLNDRPEVGSVGKARSSGGRDAAVFIRPGMPVLEEDGTFLGLVAEVERDRIRIENRPGEEGAHYLPMMLIDGVDDARVILESRCGPSV